MKAQLERSHIDFHSFTGFCHNRLLLVVLIVFTPAESPFHPCIAAEVHHRQYERVGVIQDALGNLLFLDLFGRLTRPSLWRRARFTHASPLRSITDYTGERGSCRLRSGARDRTGRHLCGMQPFSRRSPATAFTLAQSPLHPCIAAEVHLDNTGERRSFRLHSGVRDRIGRRSCVVLLFLFFAGHQPRPSLRRRARFTHASPPRSITDYTGERGSFRLRSEARDRIGRPSCGIPPFLVGRQPRPSPLTESPFHPYIAAEVYSDYTERAEIIRVAFRSQGSHRSPFSQDYKLKQDIWIGVTHTFTVPPGLGKLSQP
jgi:hypothetical protein